MLKNPLDTQSRVHFKTGEHLFSQDKDSALVCSSNFQKKTLESLQRKEFLSLAIFKAAALTSVGWLSCQAVDTLLASTRNVCSVVTRTSRNYLHGLDGCQQTHSSSTWEPKHQKNDQRNLSVCCNTDWPSEQTKTLQETRTYGVTLPSMANSHSKHFWR